MFEYHGWIQVRATPGLEADDEQAVSVGETIIEQARELGRGSDPVDARWVNGYVQVHFGGLRRRRAGAEEPLAFFHRVAEQAPGSYGLLYYWDDADPRGEEAQNQFRVLVMARGQVTERIDGFLSPCVPTIEDEVDVDTL